VKRMLKRFVAAACIIVAIIGSCCHLECSLLISSQSKAALRGYKSLEHSFHEEGVMLRPFHEEGVMLRPIISRRSLVSELQIFGIRVR
jgi:hypothetical protein